MPVSRVDQTIAEGVTLTLSTAAREALEALKALETVNSSDAESFLALIGEQDYFALLAYVGPKPPELATNAARSPHHGGRTDPSRDDVRLRTAVSPLDRTAAQGRTEHRRFRRGVRGAASRLPHSRVKASRSARSSSPRRSAISSRSTRPDEEPCTCSCPSPIPGRCDRCRTLLGHLASIQLTVMRLESIVPIGAARGFGAPQATEPGWGRAPLVSASGSIGTRSETSCSSVSLASARWA